MITDGRLHSATIDLRRAVEAETGNWDISSDPDGAYLVDRGAVVAQVARNHDGPGYMLRIRPAARPSCDGAMFSWPEVNVRTARFAVAAAVRAHPDTQPIAPPPPPPPVEPPPGVDFLVGSGSAEVIRYAVEHGVTTVALAPGRDAKATRELRSLRAALWAAARRAGYACSITSNRETGIATVTVHQAGEVAA